MIVYGKCLLLLLYASNWISIPVNTRLSLCCVSNIRHNTVPCVLFQHRKKWWCQRKRNRCILRLKYMLDWAARCLLSWATKGGNCRPYPSSQNCHLLQIWKGRNRMLRTKVNKFSWVKNISSPCNAIWSVFRSACYKAGCFYIYYFGFMYAQINPIFMQLWDIQYVLVKPQ